MQSLQTYEKSSSAGSCRTCRQTEGDCSGWGAPRCEATHRLKSKTTSTDRAISPLREGAATGHSTSQNPLLCKCQNWQRYQWARPDRPAYPRRRRRIMATLAEWRGGRCRPPVSRRRGSVDVGAWAGRGVIAGASGSASFRPRRSRQGRIRPYTWRQEEPRPHLERVRC